MAGEAGTEEKCTVFTWGPLTYCPLYEILSNTENERTGTLSEEKNETSSERNGQYMSPPL
jgi:hypothetical protein